MAALNGWFRSLAAREQLVVRLGALLAAILLVVAALLPLERRVSGARERVASRQADLAWLQSLAPRLATAGPAAAPASGEPLVVLVDRLAREAHIARSLAGSQPSGDGSLSVRLEQAPFDAVAGWSAALVQGNGVHIVSASVEGAGGNGLVNATFVLRGP